MATAELPLVLSTPRWHDFVFTGFFAVIAFEVATSGPNGSRRWVAVSVAAVCVLIGVWSIVCRPRLEVSETNITEVGLLSRAAFELRRCGQFRARTLWGRGGRPVVTFDYDVPSPRGNQGRANAKRRTPNSHVDTHGQDAEELAALLNQRRDHARRT
jgi:hypothetical protein